MGTVDEVGDLEREQILDGIVIKTTGASRRFVDAPEVARTAERAVTLTIPGGRGRSAAARAVEGRRVVEAHQVEFRRKSGQACPRSRET